MTPASLKATLDRLGWSARQLSITVGLSPRAASNWLLGRSPVPANIASWLERQADAHEQAMRDDPPPRK